VAQFFSGRPAHPIKQFAGGGLRLALLGVLSAGASSPKNGNGTWKKHLVHSADSSILPRHCNSMFHVNNPRWPQRICLSLADKIAAK